jgi:hypothetical protein
MLNSNISTVKPNMFFTYVVRQGGIGQLDKYMSFAVFPIVTVSSSPFYAKIDFSRIMSFWFTHL